MIVIVSSMIVIVSNVIVIVSSMIVTVLGLRPPMRHMQPPMGMGPGPGGMGGPPMAHHPGPGPSQDEPPSKKQKTEDNLIPEDVFLQKNKVGIWTFPLGSGCLSSVFLSFFARGGGGWGRG